MKEIKEKLAELKESYLRQLQVYEQIKQVGSAEQGLIDQGYLDQLLEVLRDKETLLRKAGAEEAQIKSIQDMLLAHFQLDVFSIPQLKRVASSRYTEDLASLEEVVSGLVPLLEALEEQERNNEALLSQYLAASKEPEAGVSQAKRAKQAYKCKKR